MHEPEGSSHVVVLLQGMDMQSRQAWIGIHVGIASQLNGPQEAGIALSDNMQSSTHQRACVIVCECKGIAALDEVVVVHTPATRTKQQRG